MARYDALTEKEHRFIEENAEKMKISEIAESIGRSYFTVQKALAAKGYHRFHLWTAEEDRLLIRLKNEGWSSEYIARRLHVGADCVYNRVRRLRKQGVRI